jgi:hypothetical protein
MRKIHSKAYQEWRQLVKARDNYVCQVCNRKSTKRNYLHVHHLIPCALVSELTLEVNNGITLCAFHHIEFHRAKLDIELLPTIYKLYKSGNSLSYLLQHPSFIKLGSIPFGKQRKHELLRVICKDYKKALQVKYPDFKLPC